MTLGVQVVRDPDSWGPGPSFEALRGETALKKQVALRTTGLLFQVLIPEDIWPVAPSFPAAGAHGPEPAAESGPHFRPSSFSQS